VHNCEFASASSIILTAEDARFLTVHFFLAFFPSQMDYYSGGDLLDQEGFKGEEAAAAVIAKVLAALRYCHGHGIAHRDIKPENVMYSYPGAQAEIKLVDFGLSSRNLSVSQEVVGSWLFMAPETLRRQEHSPYLADMWGVGCLAFNLLAGYQPFRGATLGSVKAAIAAAQVRFDGKIWRLHSPEAKDFVASLLRKSPQERLTPGEALSHPWIARVLERTPPPSALDPFPRAGLKGEVISRLRSFRDTELFERIAWAAVARSLEPRMLHRLSRNFHKADAANQGVITEEDLRRVLRESDDVPAGDFEPMLASVRCKPVTFNEFVAALLDETQIDRRHLRLAFDRMDCDSDGAIDASDLQTILGSALSLEQAHEAIAFFNGSDRVTFPQFCSSLRRMQLSPISISPRPSLSFDTAASNGTGDRKEGQCDILSAAD
jgi:calcium-dependent protein kinase